MRRLLIVIAALAVALPARAEPVRPPWYVKPMALDTGLLANWSEAETVAIDEVIGEAGAPWIQVRLSGWNLGEQSRLYLTSLEDGDTQVHTAATLRTWQGRSAIFRGGLVRAGQAFPQRLRQQGALLRRKAQCFGSNLINTHKVTILEVSQR